MTFESITQPTHDVTVLYCSFLFRHISFINNSLISSTYTYSLVKYVRIISTSVYLSCGKIENECDNTVYTCCIYELFKPNNVSKLPNCTRYFLVIMFTLFYWQTPSLHISLVKVMFNVLCTSVTDTLMLESVSKCRWRSVFCEVFCEVVWKV